MEENVQEEDYTENLGELDLETIQLNKSVKKNFPVF